MLTMTVRTSDLDSSDLDSDIGLGFIWSVAKGWTTGQGTSLVLVTVDGDEKEPIEVKIKRLFPTSQITSINLIIIDGGEFREWWEFEQNDP